MDLVLVLSCFVLFFPERQRQTEMETETEAGTGTGTEREYEVEWVGRGNTWEELRDGKEYD